MNSKILFLVPDVTMVEHTRNTLRENNLDILVEQGMLDNFMSVVPKYIPLGLEVVVARAGTANAIRNAGLGVTVVELPITAIDIIHAVEKARVFGTRIAVVAFQSMVLGIEDIARILGVEIGYFYLKDRAENAKVILEAFSRGYDVVLGGALASSASRNHNIPHVFIESSKESILMAAFEAKRIAEAIETEKYKRIVFSTVLDYAHDGIITVDTKGAITSINPAAVALTRFKNAIGKNIHALWPTLDLRQVIASGIEHLNQLIKINDVQVHCNKVPLMVSGRVAGATITFQDITKIQQLEARIRKEVYASGHVAGFTFNDIWGDSSAVLQAIGMARDYSRTNSNILILGETGTGKEVFAQSIHNHSNRQHGPFVAVNCAALPSQILESELFGYVRGAFTGANKEGKPGLFEVAHGGTIFLDEVAELDYVNQGRLLRVLQEKALVRLGSDRVIPVDIRIIAATNQDLAKAVSEKKFRDDLFYRLNVLKLVLPPLRERKRDIRIYANKFLERYASANGCTLSFKPAALRLMDRYDWPGNIRQLQHTIERVAVICKDAVVSEAVLSQCLDTSEASKTYQAIACQKIDEVVKALTLAKGKRGDAAKILGIDRSTLWRRMKRLGISSL